MRRSALSVRGAPVLPREGRRRTRAPRPSAHGALVGAVGARGPTGSARGSDRRRVCHGDGVTPAGGSRGGPTVRHKIAGSLAPPDSFPRGSVRLRFSATPCPRGSGHDSVLQPRCSLPDPSSWVVPAEPSAGPRPGPTTPASPERWVRYPRQPVSPQGSTEAGEPHP